jgi:hypothetical protein
LLVDQSILVYGVGIGKCFVSRDQLTMSLDFGKLVTLCYSYSSIKKNISC